MALTEAETIKTLKVLGLPVRTDKTFGLVGVGQDQLRTAEIVRAVVASLNADQEAEVKGLLVKWAEVEAETDTINAEGLSQDPARTRRRLRRLMCETLGLPAPRGGFRLARA